MDRSLSSGWTPGSYSLSSVCPLDIRDSHEFRVQVVIGQLARCLEGVVALQAGPPFTRAYGSSMLSPSGGFLWAVITCIVHGSSTQVPTNEFWLRPSGFTAWAKVILSSMSIPFSAYSQVHTLFMRRVLTTRYRKWRRIKRWLSWTPCCTRFSSSCTLGSGA